MPAVYNTIASQPIGSANINISGVFYIVEGEFSPQRSTREIRRNDENGDFLGRQLRTEPSTLSVTLQRSTTSVNSNGPNMGDNSLVAFGSNWVVQSVKPRQVQGGFHLFDVTFVAETLPSA